MMDGWTMDGWIHAWMDDGWKMDDGWMMDG